MIVFIGCVKNKKSYPTKAEYLYDSQFFKKCLEYARSLNPDTIYILSAKYGVVDLNDVIEPYDRTLNTMTKVERIEWSDMVHDQLVDLNVDFHQPTVWLCGTRYRTDLIKYFPESTCPFEGLGIGYQLSFMTSRLSHTPPIEGDMCHVENLW